jgi:AraC-like DNA-binding protein
LHYCGIFRNTHMTELFVRSLPLKDVIANLAEEMKTTYSYDCDEYTVQVPENYGEGTIKGINFSHGFGLLEYNCEFKEETRISFTVDKIHPLKFIYCSEGFLKHKFDEHEDIHQINQYEHIIVASTQENGHILIFPKNKKIKMNSLEISRKEFTYKLDCDIKRLSPPLEKLFGDFGAKNLFYHQGKYSLEMSDCINQINNSSSKEFVRRLFLEGKAIEILSIQIQDFIDDLADDSHKQILRKADLDKIHLAAKILKQELASPLTVKNLAKKVGTNTTKLQEGFNLLFKTSVNNYLKKIRLEYAKEQLIIGDLNIGEIASKIGIINKSYFSRLFKEAYGVNPKELSKQLKTKKS